MSDNEAFDVEQIRAVIRLAAEADIAELEVESPTLRVLVRKALRSAAPGAAPGTAPAAGSGTGRDTPPAEAAPPESAIAAANHLQPITAPMVGTFYRAPSPDAPPYVDEGDMVDAGQTVCIIEAMKLFNEIKSELQGRVAKVLVENGAPVEYGQPLFLIEPAPGGA
ncbi:MAG: acetyl-CoA carboxylase biotin carboxyl carrier protein [Armatimonadota bacterium]|nr:acetyl-CoA carboxylase biotin carboxyl carrier protein [Armatimonadota bacterium]MDR7451115.1 acetyl-CoA carboxylase biotin carboxyl carrier protein [Armatimonadota bacterium]MDR7467280.1 acetyl-CoA carboxylase biotin carboxyl carrier protein [Armatimonadota bacterium]MDR7494541.1 acetyl-CoA carboxylase biotin carboxyl carrier protein [Armatimonadota bacterium]MDR7499882.1 acetyl-CoA carboxylase biotin carboxyl carrier protein [Armatimonadota bacterium]